MVLSWFGPTTSRSFFAEGYTGRGYTEYISLLNAGAHAARARLTLYRTDGASTSSMVRLAPLSHTSIRLNNLAPNVSTAARVEADGRVVAEQAEYAGTAGGVSSGASLPSRTWTIAAAIVGRTSREALRLFNPYAAAAAVTISAYGGHGIVRISHELIGAETRLNLLLDDMAPVGASGLQISSSNPIVVASVAARAGYTLSIAPALTVPSRDWYFPDGGTDRRNGEVISVLNPSGRSTRVRLILRAAATSSRTITIRIPPHSDTALSLERQLRRPGLAVEVVADRPIFAQARRTSGGETVALMNGALLAARSWAFADGYTGRGFKEWLTLLNPGSRVARVAIRLIGVRGVVRRVVIRERAHAQTYVYLNPLVRRGAIAAVVDADSPIVASRTMIFNNGKGLDTNVGVILR